jgi:hypothetical protein
MIFKCNKPCTSDLAAHPLLYSRYIMKKLLLLGLVLPACVVGSEGGQTPPGEDPPDDPPPGSGISGNITSDQTWTGTTQIAGGTIIDPGVTVTVEPGTTLNFAAAANLQVQGTLNVLGAKGSEVIIQPDPTLAQPAFFGGLNISGTVSMTYVVQHGGSIVTTAGGSFTATDTKMFGASGDFLIMNGGTVNVSYSQIGADVGSPDTTHCNMHFGGQGNQISVTKSKIIGTPYGLMFYGGTGAIFTENNWELGPDATPTYWIDSAAQVTGDFSLGYFSNGVGPTPKANAILTADNLSLTPLLDAGVR